MVSDDAEGDVCLFLIGVTGGTADRQSRAVGKATELFEFIEDRAEDVGIVIRNAGVGEVGEVFCSLDD